MGEKFNWEGTQREVIESPSEKRTLVDAGPGTGKTAVACARVAWLIDNEKINPNDIWLISFTRTAVHEIRNRIKSFLDDQGAAYAVNIATLDSHAWKIHSGFNSGAEILGTFDGNIEKLTKLIQKDKDGDISRYLKTVQHLIIDEAQDMVGIRAELVLEIIRNLSNKCGVTVFSDEAQAIYGFSLDEDSNIERKNQKTLSKTIREKCGDQFCYKELKKVFRTQSPNLSELFTATRQKVIKASDQSDQKFSEVKEEISRLADDNSILHVDGEQNYPENCFILYRKKAEVLMAANFLGKTPHRIRMSGLPHCIHPWIGACLSKHTRGILTRKDFMNYWSSEVEGTSLGINISQESAWEQLRLIAGKTNTMLDMSLLRQRLGNGNPPAEFCYHEIGTKGPIIGTIHASKGREEDKVYLMIPAKVKINEESNTDLDEETRVLFVGATRAKNFLGVGKGYKKLFPRKLETSGRIFAKMGKMNAMVQIGLDGDINATGIAGRNYYESAEIVSKNQKRLYSLANRITMASAKVDYDCNYAYRLLPEDEEEDIAVLSEQALKGDLFEIGTIISGNNLRPPDKLKFLRIYGIRTIVLQPDSHECNNLYEPWARSGIILAPVVLGYTKEFFPYYGRRN